MQEDLELRKDRLTRSKGEDFRYEQGVIEGLKRVMDLQRLIDLEDS